MSNGIKDSSRREVLKRLGLGAAAMTVAGPLVPARAEAAKCDAFDVDAELRKPSDQRDRAGITLAFHGGKTGQVMGVIESSEILHPKMEIVSYDTTRAPAKNQFGVGVAPDARTLGLAVSVLDSGQLSVHGVGELMARAKSEGRCTIKDVNIEISLL